MGAASLLKANSELAMRAAPAKAQGMLEVFRSWVGAVAKCLHHPAVRALFFEVGRGWKSRGFVMFALLPLAAAMLVLGWRLASQIKPDPDAADQGAYAYMARSMKGARWPFLTDGARNPLFPWLAAKFMPPSFESHGEIGSYLVAGKRFNAVLATLVMLGMGWYLSARLPPVAVWNVCAVGGLGCLLPIASYFGAEPLFYGLFFAMWMTGTSLLQRNPLWMAALFSLWVALAYLAKPSTTPFVALLMLFSLVRWALQCVPRLPLMLVAEDWKPWRLVAGAVLYALIFGTLTLPKNLYSAERFEEPFYNAPKVWFWIYDWAEAYPKYQLVRKSDLAALPPEERPGPANFLRRHGWDGAWFKLSEGTLLRLEQLFLPEKSFTRRVERPGRPKRVVLPYRGLYLAGALGLLLVMVAGVVARGRWGELRGWVLPVVFSLGAFAGYILAYGWFAGIGPGPRYVMSLYLPMLALAMLAGHHLRKVANWPSLDALWVAAQTAPLLMIVPRALALLADPRFDRMLYAF